MTWIVALAWMYVATLMALAEATHPQGSWIGACLTFLMYGLGPVALSLYILRAPKRRQQRLARERQQLAGLAPAPALQPATATATTTTTSDPDSAPHSPPPTQAHESATAPADDA